MSRIKKKFLDIELRKKGVHSHGFPENYENHVWRQDSAEERSEDHFRSPLLQAYIIITMIKTVAYTFLTLSVGSDNRSVVSGKRKIIRINQTTGNRRIKEFISIKFEEGTIRLLIKGKRGFLKNADQLIDSHFFYRICFGTFRFWFFNLFC